jgi:hypothetical protein
MRRFWSFSIVARRNDWKSMKSQLGITSREALSSKRF